MRSKHEKNEHLMKFTNCPSTFHFVFGTNAKVAVTLHRQKETTSAELKKQLKTRFLKTSKELKLLK